MADELVGTTLRARRESLGLSIEHMAHVTNIRPRLLETFEASEYEKYPPRGYASGMLSSYARALGLDPRPILSGYALELDNFNQRQQIEAGARGVREGKDRFGFKRGGTPSARRESFTRDRRQTTGSMEPVPGATDTAGDIARATSAIKVVGKSSRLARSKRNLSSAQPDSASQGTGRLEAYKRHMETRDAASSGSLYTTGSYAAAKDLSSTGRLTKLASATGAIEVIGPDDVDSGASSDYELRRKGRRKPTSRGSHGRRQSSAPAAPQSLPQRLIGIVSEAFSDKRTRMIAIAVVLIVLALVIVASLLLSSAGNRNAGILDVTGTNSESSTTETSTDSKTGAAVATVTTANGNPVVVSVDVAQGKTSLISVTYDDDKAFDGTAVGPWHRDFQVTKSFSATFGTPSAVTVTENGTTIDIPTTQDGSGSLEINVQASGLASKD